MSAPGRGCVTSPTRWKRKQHRKCEAAASPRGGRGFVCAEWWERLVFTTGNPWKIGNRPCNYQMLGIVYKCKIDEVSPPVLPPKKGSLVSYALRAACAPPVKNPSPAARIFGVSRKRELSAQLTEGLTTPRAAGCRPYKVYRTLPQGRISSARLAPPAAKRRSAAKANPSKILVGGDVPIAPPQCPPCRGRRCATSRSQCASSRAVVNARPYEPRRPREVKATPTVDS